MSLPAPIIRKDFEHFFSNDSGLPTWVLTIWFRECGCRITSSTNWDITRAIVSMPVLNPNTPLAVDFDSFEMADKHNDLLGMTQKLQFSTERPTFTFSIPEKHIILMLQLMNQNLNGHCIHGAHGVFKRMSQGQGFSTSESPSILQPRETRPITATASPSSAMGRKRT